MYVFMTSFVCGICVQSSQPATGRSGSTLSNKIIQAPDGAPVKVDLEVTRSKIGESFGFGVGTAKSGEKIIVHVNPDGPAEGIIQVADKLLSVNGKNVETMSHDDCLELFDNGLTCTATVERNIAEDAEIAEMNELRKTKRRVSISELPDIKARVEFRRENVGTLVSYRSWKLGQPHHHCHYITTTSPPPINLPKEEK